MAGNETDEIIPNGSGLSPAGPKPLKPTLSFEDQPTIPKPNLNPTSFDNQSNHSGHANDRRRLKLPDEAYQKRERSNSARHFDKLRRISRACELPRLPRMKGRIDYKTLFKRFTHQSTIHGVSHAGNATKRRWLIFWCTAFAICVCFLSIQVMLLLKKYFEYPKTVDLDLKFENAPFPSVTLCNLNPYKASAIRNDAATRATMEAYQNIIGSAEGVAGALLAQQQRGRRPKRQFATANEAKNRRYHQVYAQCYCEVNMLSGERKPGSCFAAFKGKISLSFTDNQLNKFHPSKCLCQLDATSKSLWPCFPYNTWKERMCVECRAELGHCPMRFYNGSQAKPHVHDEMDICLCHNEYNHCIANNANGEIPEINPSEDLESMDYEKKFAAPLGGQLKDEPTTTTTTQAPELRQALGFDELTDEIAITTQAKQNLLFTVGEKPITERISLSQNKSEFILKCSFNQKDCNIEKDFALHYDNTYGNCFTFNYDRTKAVTAHRAGANYGLRVLLFANLPEYLPTSEAVGFRVTVHDKWIAPFPDAFGYSAPTGFMSGYGVRMKKFNRISPPHGHCFDGGEDDEFFIYKGFNYSVEGCHRSCTQREVIRICGCADPTYPLNNKKIKTCSVSDPVARECIANTTHYLGRLIAEGNVPNCTCHQPCTEIGYEVSYSAARWPSGTTKLMECEISDDLCMEKYRKNAAMVQVFYEELNYETLTETPAYTLPSLMADLGGVTGLWIGASIVSLLEVVVLVIYCADAYVTNRKVSIPVNQFLGVTPKKRSVSSSIASRPIQRRTPSSKPSIVSVEIEMPQNLLRAVEEMSEISRSTEKSSNQSSKSHLEPEEPISRKNSSPYLPPGAELPCLCLYNSEGVLSKMKALCPEHGFLVRRGTGFTCTDDEEEIPDLEDTDGEWDD
uniref:Degenerin-like protein unc-105 n=1 Tax=Panagrellus redivivus TaxID=6233 RepID=A0A7E4WDD4_PANRE